MNVAEWLKEKHGPLPGWAYVGLGAVGLYALWRLRSSSSSSSATGTTTNPLTYTPTGGYSGGAYSGGGGTGADLASLLAAITGATGPAGPPGASAPTTTSYSTAPSTPISVPSVAAITNPVSNAFGLAPAASANPSYTSWYDSQFLPGGSGYQTQPQSTLPQNQIGQFLSKPIGYSYGGGGANIPIYQPSNAATYSPQVQNPWYNSGGGYSSISGLVPSSTFGSGANAFQVAGHYVNNGGGSIWVPGG